MEDPSGIPGMWGHQVPIREQVQSSAKCFPLATVALCLWRWLRGRMAASSVPEYPSSALGFWGIPDLQEEHTCWQAGKEMGLWCIS